MSARVSGVGSPDRGAPSTAIDLAAKTKESATDVKTKQMAQEFEAMFVRQILTSAKIGGASKSGGSSGGGGAAGGYQQMGVDALATAITKSGGMGLAKQIEDIVRQTEHHAAMSPPMAPPSEGVPAADSSAAPSTSSVTSAPVAGASTSAESK